MALSITIRNAEDLKLFLLFLLIFTVASTSYVVIILSKTSGHQQKWSVSWKMAELHQPDADDAKNDGKHDVPQPYIKDQEKSTVRSSRKYQGMTANVTKKPHMFLRDDSEAVQLHRQKHMERVCRNTFHIQPVDFDSNLPLNKSFNTLLDKTFVNDDYNLTVTIIYKVGASNWLHFMKDLHVISSQKFKKKWPALRELNRRTKKEVKHNLKLYTKVLFVRHPLVRLLSAFQNKFVQLPTSFYVGAANRIIRKVRGKDPANLRKPDMTFTEFLTFLVRFSSISYDLHWVRFFQVFKPCHMRYNFIGKLETLLQDVNYLTEKLGVKGKVEYRYPKPGWYTGSYNKTILVNYYSKVPLELVEKICQIYRDDFIAFDYPFPSNFSNLKAYLEALA